MKRRDFLSLCGLTIGACIIPSRVARIIRDTCILNGEVYIPRSPAKASVMHAVREKKGFLLLFGNKSSHPTWREYIEEYLYIDINNKPAVDKWMREMISCDPDFEADFNLDDEVSWGVWQEWIHWNSDPVSSREAQAFHYLSDLPLSDGGIFDSAPLGKLSCIEGDRPGSNLTYVQAADLATLACLQHRLNTLDENVKIKITETYPD